MRKSNSDPTIWSIRWFEADPTKLRPDVDATYAERYRDLYQHHWWWRARENFVLRVIESTGARGRILDVGCGDGLFFEPLRRFLDPSDPTIDGIEGIEPDGAIVTDAGRRRGTIHVRSFDCTFTPGHRYDLIVMLDVLEHLDDDTLALGHIHDLLTEDGRLVLTVPSFQALWTRHDEINQHRTRYTKRSLTQALTKSALEVEQQCYFFHWLVPVKLVVRLREELIPDEPHPASIPPEVFNRFFYALSRLEQATWGKLPWPVGTSLLAVCRRRVDPRLA